MGNFLNIWHRGVENVNRRSPRKDKSELGDINYELKEELRQVIQEWEKAGYISKEHPYPPIETVEDVRRLSDLVSLWRHMKKKEYKDILLVLSPTSKCENWCDFCSFNSKNSGKKMLDPVNLAKIDKKLLGKIQEVQLSGGGDPLAYKYQINGLNVGILAPIAKLYERGIRRFSILTAGIPNDRINDEEYLEPILLLQKWLEERSDIKFKLHISFHLHHAKYKNDIGQHFRHYAQTINLFKDFPNTLIHLKFMTDPRKDKEELHSLSLMFKELPAILKGFKWKEGSKTEWPHLTNGSVTIKRSGRYYIIDYSISKRKQPQVFSDTPKRELPCNIFTIDSLFISEEGTAKACADYFNKLGGKKINLFNDKFDDFFPDLERERKERMEFLKEHFADIIQGLCAPQYCRCARIYKKFSNKQNS